VDSALPICDALQSGAGSQSAARQARDSSPLQSAARLPGLQHTPAWISWALTPWQCYDTIPQFGIGGIGKLGSELWPADFEYLDQPLDDWPICPKKRMTSGVGEHIRCLEWRIIAIVGKTQRSESPSV